MKRLITIGALVTACLAVPTVSTGPAAATFDDDNGRIAFRRFLDAEQTTGAIFTVNPDGTDERQVTNPAAGFVDRNPDVSPDGRRIVFQRQGETMDDIFVVKADGSGLRQLTNTGFPEGNCLPDDGECNTSPAWSPNGKWIVFGRAFGPVVDDYVETFALFMMRADGSRERQLTQLDAPPTGATGEDLEPQFSPDGTKVLFQRANVRTAQAGGRNRVVDPGSAHRTRAPGHAVPAAGGGHPGLVPGRPPDPVPRQPEPSGRVGQPVHDQTQRHRTEAAHLRRRRHHPLPRLLLLARRHVDHRREAAGHRRGRGRTQQTCS